MPGRRYHPVMEPTPLEELLAEALRDLTRYVEERDETADADDDVRALEDLTHVLLGVAPEDRDRLVSLLGPWLAYAAGLVEDPPPPE